MYLRISIFLALICFNLFSASAQEKDKNIQITAQAIDACLTSHAPLISSEVKTTFLKAFTLK